VVSLVHTSTNELGFQAIYLAAETLPNHRGNGYAKSNTAAITKHLLENGFEVMTSNGTNNIASVKTVESLGFKRYACDIAFCAI
jgi:predicted GNAT family acetyltransferase